MKVHTVNYRMSRLEAHPSFSRFRGNLMLMYCDLFGKSFFHNCKPMLILLLNFSGNLQTYQNSKFWYWKTCLKLMIFLFFFCEEPTFINGIFLKYFIFWKCAQFLLALFIILVGEKILISTRCICFVHMCFRAQLLQKILSGCCYLGH